MKKILLLATAFVFTLGAMAQTNADAVAKMNTEVHDFGKIKQGVPVTFDFIIKNIGDKPLVVESATAGCGCTTPKKPEEPIMPGQTGILTVQYNAAAVAPFTKDVTIKFAGIDAPKMVKITGEVMAAQTEEVAPASETSVSANAKPLIIPAQKQAAISKQKTTGAKPVLSTAKPKN